MFITWTRDPEQTTNLVRTMCPFPVHHIEFRAMPREKVELLLAAIVPWRVRRGGHWFRTPPEMQTAIEGLAKELSGQATPVNSLTTAQ